MGNDDTFICFAASHDQPATAGVGDQAGVPANDFRSVVHVPDEVGLPLRVGETGQGTGQPAKKGAQIPQQAGTVRPGFTKRAAFDVRQHPDQVLQSVPSIDPRDGIIVL